MSRGYFGFAVSMVIALFALVAIYAYESTRDKLPATPEAIAQVVNMERQKAGLVPLVRDDYMDRAVKQIVFGLRYGDLPFETSAEKKAAAKDAVAKYGPGMVRDVQSVDFMYTQSEGSQVMTGEWVVREWMKDPNIRAVLLSRDYTTFGADVVVNRNEHSAGGLYGIIFVFASR